MQCLQLRLCCGDVDEPISYAIEEAKVVISFEDRAKEHDILICELELYVSQSIAQRRGRLRRAIDLHCGFLTFSRAAFYHGRT